MIISPPVHPTHNFGNATAETGTVDPPTDASTSTELILTKMTTTDHHNSKRKALMCAIVRNEEAYIDECVDYQSALGFDKIRIYDSSDLNEMKIFGEKKGDHVDVIHFPGAPVAKCELQERFYHDCEEGVYTWVAFFDIDEFLVLKKHDDVHDMLEEHLQRGALGINWYIFKPTQTDVIIKAH